jgi:hypothetical protein
MCYGRFWDLRSDFLDDEGKGSTRNDDNSLPTDMLIGRKTSLHLVTVKSWNFYDDLHKNIRPQYCGGL